MPSSETTHAVTLPPILGCQHQTPGGRYPASMYGGSILKNHGYEEIARALCWLRPRNVHRVQRPVTHSGQPDAPKEPRRQGVRAVSLPPPIKLTLVSVNGIQGGISVSC